MVKSLVCFFFLLEAFISRTCLSHSETGGGPRVSILLITLSHSAIPTLGERREAPWEWAGGEKLVRSRGHSLDLTSAWLELPRVRGLETLLVFQDV